MLTLLGVRIFLIVWDLRVVFFQSWRSIVGVDVVLIDQVWDGRKEALGRDTEQTLQQRSVFHQCRVYDLGIGLSSCNLVIIMMLFSLIRHFFCALGEQEVRSSGVRLPYLNADHKSFLL